MMNDTESRDENGKAAGQAPEDAKEPRQEAQETPWNAGEAEASEAEAALGALAEENAALKDQLLRTLADMENLRQRTAREIKDARNFAIANFARDVLNVSDNLHRALAALPDSERAGADPALTALLEGVEMTERDLQATLEKHQVRRIDPMGERFDPNFHQAMFEVPDASVPAGQVVQVIQAGYVIGERMLRPAMVGVAKGGPKAATTPPGDGGSASDSADPGEAADPQSGGSAEATTESPAGAPDGGGRAGAGPNVFGGPGKVGAKIDKSA